MIPAAGMGTRMLPATDAVPKELLPVGRRPAIQWVIDEAEDAGIERFVIVSSREKPAIERYLCGPFATDRRVDVVYQASPAGLGDAVRVARARVGDEPFAVLLPDELLLGGARLLVAALRAYETTGCSSVSLLEVAADEISAYGCAAIDTAFGSTGDLSITGCVEKPDAADAPSRFAISGRYVLGADVLDPLEHAGPGARGEVQLTDALDAAARRSGLVGCTVLDDDGRVDVGTWRGWLEANMRTFASSEDPILERAEISASR